MRLGLVAWVLCDLCLQYGSTAAFQLTTHARRRVDCILQADKGEEATDGVSGGTGFDAQLPSGPIKAPRPMRGDIKTKYGGSKPRRRSNQGKALDIGMTNPSRLRVMGGSAKGRRLDSPEVQLRPMMGKVKEALFSTLAGFGLFDQGNARALDLFSGSGSVGIEALSRGAGFAAFVDFAQECVDVAEKNAVWCGFDVPGSARGVCGSVEDVLTSPDRFGLREPFHLVTVTPPYEEVSYADLVDWLAACPLVVEDTVVVIEYPTELGTLPPVIGDGQFVGVRNRRYGRTMIGIYVKSPSGAWNLDVRSDEFVDL